MIEPNTPLSFPVFSDWDSWQIRNIPNSREMENSQLKPAPNRLHQAQGRVGNMYVYNRKVSFSSDGIPCCHRRAGTGNPTSGSYMYIMCICIYVYIFICLFIYLFIHLFIYNLFIHTYIHNVIHSHEFPRKERIFQCHPTPAGISDKMPSDCSIKFHVAWTESKTPRRMSAHGANGGDDSGGFVAMWIWRSSIISSMISVVGH